MVPYEIAKKHAEGKELILILGGEISASHDHFNALFLKNTDETYFLHKIKISKQKYLEILYTFSIEKLTFWKVVRVYS